MGVLIAVLAVVVPSSSWDEPLAPWGANHHPTDVAKRHVVEIAAGRLAYAVRQGGTMDGANCRSPIGVGMMDGPAIEQTWESNRAVRLENLGETDVLNPWLSNGHNDFRTLDEIVASAVQPGMTDREKAFALWFQETRYRYHWEGDNAELGDPVKVFNVYGHNTCGNDSICLAGLWRRAGLKVTPARLVGHCVPQAFFDGRWGHADPVKYHGTNKPRYPDTICNGLWEYRPDFSRNLWKKGTGAVEGVRASGGELTAEEGKTGTVLWIIRSPYVLVGGRLDVE